MRDARPRATFIRCVAVLEVCERVRDVRPRTIFIKFISVLEVCGSVKDGKSCAILIIFSINFSVGLRKCEGRKIVRNPKLIMFDEFFCRSADV